MALGFQQQRDMLHRRRFVVDHQHPCRRPVRLAEAQPAEQAGKIVLEERLLQHGRGAEGEALFLLGDDGDHHHRDAGPGRAALQPVEELPAVLARQDDVEGDEVRRLRLQFRARLGGIGGARDLEAVLFQRQAQQLEGARLVLHHQHAAAGRLRRRPLAVALRGEALEHRPAGQPDAEGRAPARFALHGHGAAVQLGQAPDQRQAEAGALVLARERGVDLGEGGEQPRLVRRRDADAGGAAAAGASAAGRRRTESAMRPPSGVNFTALESRL